MTNRPTLPPQAYTREMLSTAFQWLQSQPESIKKLAHTPDALVGLYLRAQKFGHTSPEADAPVSSQAFVADLKNLAEGLKQFDGPVSEPKATMRAPQPSQTGFASRIRTEALNVAAAASAATTAAFAGAQAAPYPNSQASYEVPTHAPAAPQPQIMSQMPNQIPAQVHHHAVAPTSHANLSHGLNPMTQAMIQEVKHHLNLSSEAEVINMMVALAYKNVKGLLA